MTTSSAPQLDTARAAALESFLKSASKDLDTRVATLSDSNTIEVRAIPTGVLSLDHALGVGGFPRGRVTELYGPTGGGKTTLALEAARQCQEAGGLVGFVDAEHALNLELVESIGIDLDRMVIIQPDTGEMAIEAVRKMVVSDLFEMIIVDSAAAMVPKAMFEADAEQQFMGLQARLLSRFMQVITGPCAAHDVALVVINQVRANLAAYGAPDESTGGKALKFFSSVRVEVRTSAGRQIKDGTRVVGTGVLATVKKNKFAAPFRTAEYDIIFGKGIDAANGVLTVAQETGVINKSGNTYTVKFRGAELRPEDLKLAVGQEKAKAALREDPELLADVEAATKARLAGAPLPEDADAAATEADPMEALLSMDGEEQSA